MKKVKSLLCIIVVLGVVSVLSACCISHEWQEATCIEPKTCSKCGKTEGDALGHEWQNATCTEPKTCTRCGETEGAALGHKWSDWEVTSEATAVQDGVRTRICTICGSTENENFGLEVLHKDGYFLMSPKEFGERLDSKLIGQDATMYYNMNGMSCGITGSMDLGQYKKGEAIASILFSSKEGTLDISEKDSKSIHLIAAKFFTTDSDKIVDTMLGIIQTCDGSVDDTGARSIGRSIIAAAQNGDITYEENGITYTFTQRKDYYIFFVGAN